MHTLRVSLYSVLGSQTNDRKLVVLKAYRIYYLISVLALLGVFLYRVDLEKHNHKVFCRVRELAQQVHGQLVRVCSGEGSYAEYWIVLPDGKIWYAPEVNPCPQ